MSTLPTRGFEASNLAIRGFGGAGGADNVGTGAASVHGPGTLGAGRVDNEGLGASAVHGPGTLGAGGADNTGTGAVSVHGPGALGAGPGLVAGSAAVSVAGPGTSGSGTSAMSGSGGVSVAGPGTLGLVAASNTSPFTAILITLPASITVDLHNAITTGLWYKYTPGPAEFYLGVQVQPNPPGAYNPVVLTFTDIALDPANPSVASATLPIQMPVNPGQTYYFQFIPSGSPPMATFASFTVVAAPNHVSSVGDIFVPDDTPGFRAVIMRASDGLVIRAVPYPAGEFGDILPSGVQCVEAEDTPGHVASLQVFGSQFALLATRAEAIRGPNATIIRSDLASTFYIVPRFSGVNPTIVHAISSAGALLGSTWSIANDNIGGAAPSRGGAILYWADAAANKAIKRHDLHTDTPLSDLAAGVSGFTCEEMLVLSDDTILVAYKKSPVNLTLDFVRHYSAAGATLRDYAMSSYAETAFTHLGRATTDPLAFTLWKQTRATQSSTWSTIAVSDGSVVHAFRTDDFEFGIGPNGTTQSFGPSFSCPFFLMASASGVEVGCVGVTLTVRLSRYQSQLIATGGTPPYTFAIVAGQLPPGLTLDPTTGIISGNSLLEGNFSFTVRVTDANGFTSTNDCGIVVAGLYGVVEKNIRRERIAPHLSNEQKRVFYPAMQVEVRPGIGNTNPPGVEPKVLLSMSFDGGFTWTPEITMSAGAIGDYRKRVIARQLGYGRDTVFRVVVSDPNIWDLIGAYFDPPPIQGLH